MVETSFETKIYVVETWTTDSILNSLLKFPSGSSVWGKLSYIEISEGENYIDVNILKDSDNSVLISGLRGVSTGLRNEKAIDLSQYSIVGSNDIKIRFNFNMINKTPILREISLSPKQAW